MQTERKHIASNPISGRYVLRVLDVLKNLLYDKKHGITYLWISLQLNHKNI